MRILILTQYFPPEVGAPQNRLFELAVRLKKFGHSVSVLTAMPNYPQMEIHEFYKGKLFFREELNGLDVRRSWIYSRKSKGVFSRLLNYYSFVVSSFFYGLFAVGRHDIILVESPPLFLGKTAWLLSHLKRSKMIFNVSDLWPESAERLGIVNNRLFLNLAYRLEAFLYRRAWLVTGQTQGIVKNIESRFPNVKCYWLPNGVDLNFFQTPHTSSIVTWRKKYGFAESDFIVMYAGILGHAQGLEVVLHSAKQFVDHSRVKFVFLGSGPEKDSLLNLSKELKLTNVFFPGTITKQEMPLAVASCDASVIPLKKLEIFKGAIPSKIFENLGMKKPILLGVEGEAKELFIDEGKGGLAFIPENPADLSEKIQFLIDHPEQAREMGESGYRFVSVRFERDIVAEKFNKFLLDFIKSLKK